MFDACYLTKSKLVLVVPVLLASDHDILITY